MPTTDTPQAHVLLIEDEAFLRELLVENLQDAGYAVLEASDGSAALELLQSDRRIDVLLSDIKLPDMDGYQIAQAGHALRPELKVILMTGYAPTPLPAALQTVVHGVLQKPFSLDALPEMVASALGS
jgi:CheY-like chemotaxis protein